jgi:hypothetical protein
MSDIGAMLFGRWHDSHFCWKIGATSLVKVTVLPESAAAAGIADAPNTSAVKAMPGRNPDPRFITPTIPGSFSNK